MCGCGGSRAPKIIVWLYCKVDAHTTRPVERIQNSGAALNRKQQTCTSDARVQQYEQTATHATHHRPQLRENASEPPKIMG